MAKKTKAATEEAAAKPAAKTKAETKEKAPVEPTEQPEEKTTRTRGKRTKDEIDDIFNSKPAKKAAKGSEEAPEAEAPTEEDAAALAKLAEKVKDARKKHEGKQPKVEGSKDDIFGETSGKARKKTEEGFAIYTEDELGMGKKGGDTDKCPFDCDCCF